MENSRKQVVIAGAGAAGLLAATELAARGFECLVVEALPEAKSGQRYCVDIDSGSILNGVVPTPKNAAIVHMGEDGGDVLAPSGRRGFNITPLPAYTVKLWIYQRQLRAQLRAAGVEFRFETSLASITPFRDGRNELELVDVRQGPRRVVCDLVVLATGNAFELDRELYAHFSIRRRLLHSQYVNAYQEMWKLDRRKTALAFPPSPPGAVSHIVGRFGPYSTLSTWVDRDCRNGGLLSGTLTCDGFPDPRKVLSDFRAQFGAYNRRESGGGGFIPIRRPIEMLVGQGVALVGQAAAQVYPATGCGVALAGQAARLLAEAASQYLTGGSMEALWRYNSSYQSTWGANQASSEAFVGFIRSSDRSGRLIEDLFESQLADSQDFLRHLELGPVVPSLAELPGKVRALAGGRRHLRRLAPALARAGAVFAAYRSFYPKEPDVHRVRDFASRVEKILAV